jgi:serine/threonine protein kinase
MLKCNYKFKNQIGKGTYGEVSIVERDGKYYAFKKIKVDETLESKKSWFWNPLEVDVVFRLNSPHLVKGYDITVPTECDPVKVGLVTEYVNGNITKDIHMFSYKDKKKIMLDLCKGLKCLHDNNYLHLDIKLDNTMYHKETPPRAVLIDYGLGSYAPFGVETGVLTTQGRFTFEFNSPQAAVPDDDVYHYTGKDDIWAMGITFCEIISDGLLNYIPDNIRRNYSVNSEKGEGYKNYLSLLNYQKKIFTKDKIVKSLDKIVFENVTYEINDKDLLIDLLKGILNINKNERYSIDQIINHPYFAEISKNDYCVTEKPKNTSLGALTEKQLEGVNKIVEICKEKISDRTSYILFMAVDIYLRFLANLEKLPEIKDEIKRIENNVPRICLLIANKYFYWADAEDTFDLELEENFIDQENIIYKVIEGRIRDERYFINCKNNKEVKMVYDYFIKTPSGAKYNPNIVNYLAYDGNEFMNSRRIGGKDDDIFELEINKL